MKGRRQNQLRTVPYTTCTRICISPPKRKGRQSGWYLRLSKTLEVGSLAVILLIGLDEGASRGPELLRQARPTPQPLPTRRPTLHSWVLRPLLLPLARRAPSARQVPARDRSNRPFDRLRNGLNLAYWRQSKRRTPAGNRVGTCVSPRCSACRPYRRVCLPTRYRPQAAASQARSERRATVAGGGSRQNRRLRRAMR